MTFQLVIKILFMCILHCFAKGNNDNVTSTQLFRVVSDIQNYTVDYKEQNEARIYTTYVDLSRNFYVPWYRVARNTTTFELTDTLNGDIIIRQNNTDRPNSYVAVNEPVRHYIKLPDNELEYLRNNASSITTYWFIDCQLVGPTEDFFIDRTYTEAMKTYTVVAIVIANNIPLPTITTTTPKPTTSKATTEPVTEKVLSNDTSNKTRKRETEELDCNNTIPYTNGRYATKIQVREPISTVNITGRKQFQHGDLLNLLVTYTGSPPFNYCVLYKRGQYNITGNETCIKPSQIASNSFSLVRYISNSGIHTVVVVIENDVTKYVSKATITIYKSNDDELHGYENSEVAAGPSTEIATGPNGPGPAHDGGEVAATSGEAVLE